MARAETYTRLSLARWFQLMGIHPLHGEQVIMPNLPPTVCSQPWLTHPWQDTDRVGREDLALAIKQAEDDIERELKATLMPTWIVDEWRPTMRTFRPELGNLSGRDIRDFGQIVFSRQKQFISGGIQAKTFVATPAIVWSDADGDGYKETGTVTAAVTFLDACELCVYYPGKAGVDEWEIRPINASINAGIGLATITFRRELTVQEDLLESFDPQSVDGLVDGNFLATVDIYRKYNDPQQQVQFLWEPFGSSCATCSGDGCPTCAYNTQYGCLMIREDPRLGIVVYHPATWNNTTLQFDAVGWAISRQPDLVRLWYYAGLRQKNLACPNRSMPLEWERAVAYYAAALLDRPVCECNNLHAWIENWRRDTAIPGEEGLQGESRWEQGSSILSNPFGTKRGAVFAWHRILRSRELPQEIAM